MLIGDYFIIIQSINMIQLTNDQFIAKLNSQLDDKNNLVLIKNIELNDYLKLPVFNTSKEIRLEGCRFNFTTDIISSQMSMLRIINCSGTIRLHNVKIRLLYNEDLKGNARLTITIMNCQSIERIVINGGFRIWISGSKINKVNINKCREEVVIRKSHCDSLKLNSISGEIRLDKLKKNDSDLTFYRNNALIVFSDIEKRTFKRINYNYSKLTNIHFLNCDFSKTSLMLKSVSYERIISENGLK
jgi:hypothetical protein